MHLYKPGAPHFSMEKRQRKRIHGRFECEHPGCGRVFSRGDHLSRHKRNYDVAKSYQCNWPGCGRVFARNDIKEKHFRRHKERQLKSGYGSSAKVAENSTVSREYDPPPMDDHPPPPSPEDNHQPSPRFQLVPIMDSKGQKPQTHPRSSGERNLGESGGHNLHPNANNGLQQSGGDLGKSLSPSDLIEWLFHDDLEIGNPPGPSPERPSGFSPMSFLESMFAVSPEFPHSNTRKNVDENIRLVLVSLIPLLQYNPEFGVRQIERCLQVYWLIYHPQYPILHKPSFSNYDAHPLLLLAMIMLGAGLSTCTGNDELAIFHHPKALADEIAGPLRWLILSNSDCKPPARLWVIQSLLLLETYEITSTTRFLHERAYLHHGAKIQLLRRSPVLGGDPLKDEDEDDAYLPANHVWKKWVEVESMKRATLMAFYLDTVHATVYGHMVVLYAHQIRLSLPCEDELWEFDNVGQKTDSFKGLKTPKFLAALKSLLHRQKIPTSSFGKKILLAGLLTIMFQMQQKDLQLSFIEWNSVKDSWTDTISLAIDVWRVDICTPGCCSTETSLCFAPNDRKLLPPMLRPDDLRCKFALYHISQIYMRITHYDYIIYAGAPSRMNVKVGEHEYRTVENRILKWSQSSAGRISVIHAYMFLFEMLLSPTNEDITYTYDPNCDPFLHRKNIMASAILVIFAYNFSLEGPESSLFDELPPNANFYPEKEDGYSYLRRIRRQLSQASGAPVETPTYVATSKNNPTSTIYHSTIRQHAENLPTVTNMNHIVGLLKVFFRMFERSNWEVGLEYSRLFQNAIERSLGRTKISCDGMYSIE